MTYSNVSRLARHIGEVRVCVPTSRKWNSRPLVEWMDALTSCISFRGPFAIKISLYDRNRSDEILYCMFFSTVLGPKSCESQLEKPSPKDLCLPKRSARGPWHITRSCLLARRGFRRNRTVGLVGFSTELEWPAQRGLLSTPSGKAMVCDVHLS